MAAQTTLATTTLNGAVGAGDQQIKLTSVASVTAGQYLYTTDGEGMKVLAVSSPWVTVKRGELLTSAAPHLTSTTVYIGYANHFYQQDPSGKPPAPELVSPWINTVLNRRWTVDASSGAWTMAQDTGLISAATGITGTIAPASGSASGTQAFTRTSSGATTVIPAASVARQVIISVQVTTAFANGDGTQPTFSIGETGSATKFAATARFTGAAANTTFSFSGTLSANTDLIVTAVAATGTTSTGALTVTAIATP